MSMHINLSKQMKAYIAGKVESGFYDNATEVIRDAVRRMQENDAQLAAFVAAVEEGDADLEAGRVLDGNDNTFNDILARVVRRKAAKEKSSGRG